MVPKAAGERAAALFSRKVAHAALFGEVRRPKCGSRSLSTARAVNVTLASRRSYNAPRYGHEGRRRRQHLLLPPCSSRRRHYATGPPTDVAVLGGGLTGLTTAFYLARHLPPSARITLYEASDRLGGWVQSDRAAETGPDGTPGGVVLERGPRVVQSQVAGRRGVDDLVLFELIAELELERALAPVPLARSRQLRRYIRYPDRLVAMPGAHLRLETESAAAALASGARLLGAAYELLTEPVFSGVLPALLRAWRLERVYHGAEDTSIGNFFSMVCGRRDVVDNMLSALVHGIYGGNVWELSVQSSVFDRYYAALTQPLEKGPRGNRQLVRTADLGLWADLIKDPRVRGLARAARGWGYISFEGGFETLTKALAAALRKDPRVQIERKMPVAGLHLHASKTKVQVSFAADKTGAATPPAALHDKVISTLYSGDLATICPPNSVPTLAAHSDAVTIQVVNLWYPTPNLNPYPGFGYLIPISSPTQPVDQNPEGALGVLFDSDREAAALRHHGDAGDAAPGTALTVMLGGHYWDGLAPALLPTAAEGVALARSVVARSLGLHDAPAIASAHLARNAIPQHRVGHFARMRTAAAELSAAFAGRVAVAGGSYAAQGVLPALRAGRDVARAVAGAVPSGDKWTVGETGLGRFETAAREGWWTATSPEEVARMYFVENPGGSRR